MKFFFSRDILPGNKKIMALKQAVVAAGLSYAVEFIGGFNPTPVRSIIAGACGAFDYYAKAKLLPMAGFMLDGNASYLAGAAAGGVAYGAMLSYFDAGTVTSGFLRGALYAAGSDLILSYISPEFKIKKIVDVVKQEAAAVTEDLVYQSPSL
mgnify:CR=1 FL=1